MKKVRITAIRKACYPDLTELYENPIQHACEVKEGEVFQKFDNHCRNLPFLFLPPLYRDTVPKNGCNSKSPAGRGKSIEALSVLPSAFVIK